MNPLNKLYDPVIKTHQANPYHFRKIADCTSTVKAHNPVCGDRFDFFITLEGRKIVSLYYHGYGCAVSMAAGSILTQSLEGKSVDEAIEMCNTCLDIIDGKTTNSNIPEDFKPFSAVIEFPSRYDCAAMAWKEMKKYLIQVNQ